MINRLLRKSPIQEVKSFSELILKHSQHDWIRADRYVHESFKELLDNIPKKFYKALIEQDMIFLRGKGQWALAFESIPNTKFVIIFDELYRSLRSGAPRLGQAVIAHEIGHLIHGHSNMHIDKLEAQVQADRFALDIGYGEELAEVIQDLAEEIESIELRVRLSYLNSFLIPKNYQN